MPTRRAATLKDVAEEAGVSTVAVSVVLNGARSNVGVSEVTRQRIIDSAARLSYRPNAVARSLRRQSTNVIGFYSGTEYASAREGVFLSQIIAGMQDGCEAHGRDLLIHGTFRGQSVDDIYHELASGKIDGLVLHAPGNDALVNLLSKASLPSVVIASPIETLPSVVVDDAHGARLVVEHLYEKGHRFIGFRHSSRYHTSALRRAEAFATEAESRDIKTLFLTPTDADNRLNDSEKSLLDQPRGERPTAIFCWNDGSAYAMLAACMEKGLRVPEDLAVVGFDGFKSPVIPRWYLSTVRAPWRDVSRRAVDLLVSHLKGDEIPRETCLPVTFRPGDTT